MNEREAIRAAEHAAEIAKFQREQTRRERARQKAEQGQPASPGQAVDSQADGSRGRVTREH